MNDPTSARRPNTGPPEPPDFIPARAVAGSRLARCLLVAAANYVTGTLALLLAIPPGYATAIWPPAGIALGAVLLSGPELWPGVWLGSFLLNASTSVGDGDRTSFWTSLLVAGIIGAGSALQALLAAAAIRRLAGEAAAFDDLRQVSVLLGIGGPICCIVASSIGVGTLLATGVVPLEDAAYSWWTWWVGDSIGVMIVLPLMLIGFGRPRELWRRRAPGVLGPLLPTVALVVVLFVYFSRLEHESSRVEFERQAADLATALHHELQRHEDVLHGLAAFVESSEGLDRERFRRFVERPLERFPAIRLVSWNPIVTPQGQGAFEAAVRARDGGPFEIWERAPDGSRRRAAADRERCVVRWIEPIETNADAVGYDVCSEPVRREALDRSRRHRRPAATAPLRLVQDPPGRPRSILLFHPARHQPRGAAGEREDEAATGPRAGFVVGGFDVAALFVRVLESRRWPGLRLELRDGTGPGPAGLVFAHPEGVAGHGRKGESGARGERDGPIEWTTRIDASGRDWLLRFRPAEGASPHQHTWHPWMTLAGGLLLSGLLAAFQLVLTGQNCRLADIYRELESAVEGRREMEARMHRSQKMEAIGSLAGGIAHDFNNLLTVILGTSEHIRGHTRADDELREEARQISYAAERGASLTRKLLSFGRRQMLQPKVLDLNELLRDLRPVLPRLIGERIRLEWRLDPRPLHVKVDPAELEQAVLNLSANSRDAMPRGGVLELSTAYRDVLPSVPDPASVEAPEGFALLEVADSGEGMDPATLSRVFEPFFTTKEVGKGTGLGLASVYGFVKQSGGEAIVESAPGRGTVVRLYLPLVRAVLEPLPSETAPAPRVARILVVEDDPGVRAYLVRALAGTGFEIFAADGGPGALELWKSLPGPIDLVVTDVIMPGMNGHELVDRLSADRPGLRVLYVSGYTDDVLASHGLAAGRAEVLQKPFKPAELVERVRGLLERP